MQTYLIDVWDMVPEHGKALHPMLSLVQRLQKVLGPLHPGDKGLICVPMTRPDAAHPGQLEPYGWHVVQPVGMGGLVTLRVDYLRGLLAIDLTAEEIDLAAIEDLITDEFGAVRREVAGTDRAA